MDKRNEKKEGSLEMSLYDFVFRKKLFYNWTKLADSKLLDLALCQILYSYLFYFFYWGL